uniref:Uncharacterized protein n=1 Tax=Phocoena sinus TaxID=42100 RepID=A0A8C9EAP8_PHOSS
MNFPECHVPPHVMSRLRLWLPRLFLTWLQLWLQVQAVQPPEWALGPVQVTPNPPRLTEAWSSYASDPPPKLPHALTPLAEAGGFNYLTSSSPVQMLAPRHQELTETEAPYPDTGSVAELPTGPHQFAVPHQDLNNKQTQHQKIPEAVPVPDWDQNQPLVLPSRHKSKTENIGLDQAEGHQSVEIPVPPLGSKSSKPMKFIVSPPNLKKDLLQRQRLAKASTGQFEKHPQGLEQQLQGDYLDPSMDAFHPEESLSRAFLGGPDEPPEPPEEAELSPSQKEAQICHPELTEEAESLRQQEAPAQHPQTPEEVESFLPQAPEELETSSPQEALAQLLETHQEVVVRLVAHHEVNEAQQSNVCNVTVKPLDLTLTITPQVTKEVEPSPVQQDTPSQPPESPEEVEPSPVQQETTGQPPEPLVEFESSPTQSPGLSNVTVVFSPEHPVTTVSPLGQDQAQLLQRPDVTVKPVGLTLIITPAFTNEAETSPPQQETSHPIPSENVEFFPVHRGPPIQPPYPEVTFLNPEQVQAHHPTLIEVTIQPLDLGLTRRPEPTKEDEPSPVIITVKPLNLELTTTPEPTTEPSETVLFPSSQNSVSTGLPGIKYTPEKKQPEQNATTNISICELCTCKNETLSCVGLSPKQKLHRVPEPEPNAYNGTFTILNFQGNSISYIDESIWKAYCWAEKLNLSENYLTELHKDSFEGLLSLRYLILNRNPLTTVEDSHLFKLPALKYLDMGTTQVSLTTIESILMMTLELEKLILPSRMACCLCQFKDTIEVVCKTLKLRCDSECLTDMTRCDEETSIGNAEGSLMKVLQARKKNTTPELTIESERASSENSAVSLSGLTSPGDQVETQLNQQLRSLIPNNDVRRLISHVIQALKMNCSETHVQLACANLVSRTGLLLKLLSKQQEANVSEAEWYTDRWKADSYISESTEAQSEQKGQESSELPKEVPGYGYNNKLILAISVSVVVTIWVTILCLIEVRTIINSDSEPTN